MHRRASPARIPAGDDDAGRPGLRPLDESLAIALLRAREAVMNRFRPLLKRHDLTEQQWRVLRVLTECSCCDAGQLAQSSCIHPASLSRILRALETRGVLRTATAKHDSRRVEVALTDAGRVVYRRMAADSESIYRQIERELGSAALASTLQSIRRLTRTLK
jgi:homoprotocatechuate degradation regulator HpaR